MAYLDGMIAAVPKSGRDAYRAHSEKLAALLRRHGALSFHENWGELLDEAGDQSLATRVACGPDETVVFSWIVWPSRAARDAGWDAADEEYQALMEVAPMATDRMYVAGFEPLSDS